jgi:DNA-binding LacI/PurR family transcriptional regulator
LPDRSKPTIRDIARLAGVSRSTVSLVINDDRRISESTKRKVRRVISEAGYEPSTFARGLARRRTQTLAVILPKTDSHVFSDYYFAEAISGVSDALADTGYRLLIQIASTRFLEMGGHRKLFRERGADGALLLGTLHEDRFVDDLVEARVPLVLVNSRRPGVPSVVADNRRGVREMVRHLRELGHRRIGFIGGLENTTVGEDRSRGFLEGLAEQGIPFDEQLRLWGNFSEESGGRMARQLLTLHPRPSALMAANDMMAIGALRAARDELGLRVPEELTVVGADDVRLTTYIRPRLTTIGQPMYEVGVLATRLLLDLLAPRECQREQVVATRLVLRESAGPPAARGVPPRLEGPPLRGPEETPRT